MAFQSVPNTIEVLVRGTNDSTPVENTFYYGYVATPTPEDLEELLTDLKAVVVAEWLPYLPANCGITSLYARDLEVEFASQFDLAFSVEIGTASGEALPSFNTIAFARKSGLTGRSARGRIFWMGLTEGQVANSVVDSGVLVGIADAINQFDAAAALLSYTPVIVSRYHNGVPRVPAVTYEISNWGFNDNLVDTRRSRKK